MPYPEDDTGPITHLFIDGAWVDVSSRVRGQSNIVITRGTADEQSRVTAQRSVFTLNNRDGLFSTQNPRSQYYGLLPLNTPVRHQAGEDDDKYWLAPYTDVTADIAYASTPDTASLDITGDIDIRMEVHPHTWRPVLDMTLATKWLSTGNQRSWALRLTTTGVLQLVYSTDGNNNGTSVAFSEPIPEDAGRIAIRVTADVDNGAGGKTLTAYTSDSVSGTWTTLDTSTTAGTMSFFSSSAALEIGSGSIGGVTFTDSVTFGGKLYAFQLRSGIAGSIVANPDFTTQTLGDESFADSVPLTWTLNPGEWGRITSDRVRFVGELSKLPVRWDKSGSDVFVPVRASGMIARISQGAKALRSPIYRRNMRLYTPDAYWTLEDDSDATVAGSAVARGKSTSTTRDVSFAAAATLRGAKQAPTLSATTSVLTGSAGSAAASTSASVQFYFRMAALPGTDATFLTFRMNGSVGKFLRFKVGPTGYVFEILDGEEAVLDSQSFTHGFSPLNAWTAMAFTLVQDGGNTDWTVLWHGVGTETFYGASDTYTGTPGKFTSFTASTAASASLVGAALSHVMMMTTTPDFVDFDFAAASDGYLGEAAGRRMRRLAAEEEIPFELVGMSSTSEACGYQASSTFLELMNDAADVDGGILCESRDSLALRYRCREAMERRIHLTLSYEDQELSEVPDPTDDDQGVVNEVTVHRLGGSSATAEAPDGPMSAATIGRYAADITLNAYLDARLPHLAGWRLHLGSWAGYRYPNIVVSPHRSAVRSSATLVDRVRALDVGDTAVMTDLPDWLPPEDVPLIVRGYTETLRHNLWDTTHNTSPGGPFRTARYDDEVSRYETSGSTTSGSHTSTTTTLVLAFSTTGDHWTTTSSSYPFDVMVGGERITLNNAPSGTSSPQTFTGVTRSVNGIVKAHDAGTDARLYLPVYYAL